jgi:hypothetical protein
MKTFFHRVPGARFILPDGKDVCFIDGSFSTLDEKIIDELNKVANVPSSMIYTTKEPIKSLEETEVQADLLSSATQAFDGDKKIVGGATTVPIPVKAPDKPTLAELQAAKIAAVRSAIGKSAKE